MSVDKIPITVIAIGNPIMGDDGVGPEIMRLLEDRISDDRVLLLHGGLGGMELLDNVKDTEKLLVIDAVAYRHLGAGNVVHLTGDDVPKLFAAKLSAHQVGMLDVLTAAHLLGYMPERVDVVGVIPDSIELEVGLSESVRAAIGPAVEKVEEVVRQWLSEL